LAGYLERHPLLMGSPLRKPAVCLVICGALGLLLAFAAIVHLSLLASMRLDIVLVFFRALATSSVLSLVPLVVLWFLDRRERETLSLHRTPLSRRCSARTPRR
jgi:hypothetical protein